MLLKIETIQEIGRFASLKHQAPQFGKLTLVFARNGYGKSTLCSIIRSAADQDTLLLAARRRLGARAESQVQTKWQFEGAIDFSNGHWNACPGNIYIFDTEYVRHNLYVSDSVTIENKRNLIPVVLGAKGVALANTISALDAELRERTTKKADVERLIKAAHSIITDVKAFVEANVPDDIDKQIELAERAVELARHASAVKEKKDPTSVPQITIDGPEDIAARGIADISEHAAASIKGHIATHRMHPNGERWLKYGVEHMQGTACPFCTQDTSTVPLVAQFRGYFSVAFEKLSTDIEAFRSLLKEAYGNNGEAIEAILKEHRADFAFWAGVCDLADVKVLSSEEATVIKGAIKALIDLMDRKAANPLSKTSLGLDRQSVIDGLAMLDSYRQSFDANVLLIQKARRGAATADLAKAQATLAKLNAWKAKLSAPLKSQLASWVDHERRRSEIEKEKVVAKEKLRDHMKNTISGREGDINDLLEVFGATFRIADTKASFVGREASTDFSISIKGHSVKAGNSTKAEPGFDTVLSSSDKFTLALAFFLTQVRSDPKLAEARIIMDDPFSSQDMDRQWETTSQIRALAKEACQVIVLSHDPRFLALIEKNAPSAVTFQMQCDDEGGGAIRNWSSEAELKELYVRQSERIREYATKQVLLPDVTIEALAKDLRPFAENFIKARFPGRFGPLEMLDAMIDQIEAAGNGDPMFKNVANLRAINEYNRDNMHGGAAHPQPTELQSQCKRIVRIVGNY
jgi:wobble nucleotide-excising tRNase